MILHLQEALAVDDMLDVRLAAETRAYILSLEVCSFCDRVAPCRPIDQETGWECLDHLSCAMTRPENSFQNDRQRQSRRVLSFA